MKKHVVVSSVAALAALSTFGLSACSSSPSAAKASAPSATKSSGQVVVPVVTASPVTSSEALATFLAATTKLSGVEEQATVDASADNVPAFTSDCTAMLAQGVTWNADAALLYKKFPGVLSPTAIDPSNTQLRFAEISVACQPYV